MEKNKDNIAIKEDASTFNSLDNIPRCLECNLISSLKLYYKEGKPIINYFCENNHKGDVSLDEYIQKYNTHSLLKQNVKNVIKIKMK